MKRRVLAVGGLLLALGVLGFLVAASGLIPTKASDGHWRITAWFLHFSMQRSAATHSLGLEVPPLDDEGLIIKGATHYEFGCRSCHGAPGAAPSLVTQSLLPRPADLAQAVPRMDPKQLFHIVKHGVKFTGMPAFPVQDRDDEVWAVVAFLMKLPALDEAGYRQLTGGEPRPVAPGQVPTGNTFASVNRACQQCHGGDGLGRGGHIPRLAGQRPEYLHKALDAYSRGQRSSGIMRPIAASLDEATLRQLVDYYAGLPAKSSGAEPTEADRAIVEHGRRIAHEGIRERRVPACVECHEPSGRRTNPAYPSLAGQPVAYLVRQLELFKDGHRGGSSYAHLMQPVAARLEPEEMQAVARYFGSEDSSRESAGRR